MAPLAPWKGSTKLFGKATFREIKIDNCIFQQEVVFCVKLKWRALLVQEFALNFRLFTAWPKWKEIIPLEAKIG